MISRETAKQESSSTSDNNNNNNSSKAASSTTTSWSRLKDPRIVRVSRAFGGKDRHSKVCTVRGLRDRRVRLSVPTAIQLYDLQDRLGLNQPSKVVDWLLNAAKAEIDELPPLNFPQSSFLPMLDSINQDHNRSKDIRVENWGRSLNHIHDFNSQNPSLLPINASSSSSSTSIPFNSFVRWDPSNLTLSHPSKSPNCSSPPPHQQGEDWHNFSLVAAPLPPHQHQHQVLVYQPQPYFQSQISASNAEFDANVESSTHFNMTANLLPSQNSDGGRS